ncbi:MAG: hypothetical protein WB297_05720 [Actinomycetota bacterium]
MLVPGVAPMMRGMTGRDGSTSDGTGAGAAEIRTFLIADVRGYTLFTQERGDEATGKLAAKFADIAREIVESRGGILLELRVTRRCASSRRRATRSERRRNSSGAPSRRRSPCRSSH